MPFTSEAFLDVFGRYNALLWPFVLLFWVITAAVLGWWLRAGARASRLVAALLAIHWAWSGAVYHWTFFAPINPAARLFAALFVVEAGLLAWFGVVRERLCFGPGRTAWHIAGYAMVAYALVYPVLSATTGHSWARAPLFAVPCPTTLLTMGLLLTADPLAAAPLTVVPLLWSAVGGSAAALFGVWPDLALPVSGTIVLCHVVAARWRRRSGAAQAACSSGQQLP